MSEKKTIKEKIKGVIADYKLEATTKEEAKRKRISHTIVYGCILGVTTLILSFLYIVIGLIWAVISVCILVGFWFMRIKQESRNFCDKCGEKFDYENNVAWEAYEFEEKTYSIPNNPTNKSIIKKRIAKVKITCYCDKCGDKRDFNQNFEVCEWYYGGGKQEHDLNLLVNNYFKL